MVSADPTTRCRMPSSRTYHSIGGSAPVKVGGRPTLAPTNSPQAGRGRGCPAPPVREALVQDVPQHRRLVAGQAGLPLHPGSNQLLDGRFAILRPTHPDQITSVLLGFQQPRDDERLPAMDTHGFALQRDDRREPRRVSVVLDELVEPDHAAGQAELTITPLSEVERWLSFPSLHVRYERARVPDLLPECDLGPAQAVPVSADFGRERG